ncbi:MAG: hypothetical protein AAGD14_13405 [Planctomycetota bacterium]
MSERRSRPGILDVFWPAFMAWGSSVGFVPLNRPLSSWSPISIVQTELVWTFAVLIMASPLAVLLVMLRFREARSPVAILIHLTTLPLAHAVASEIW